MSRRSRFRARPAALGVLGVLGALGVLSALGVTTGAVRSVEALGAG